MSDLDQNVELPVDEIEEASAQKMPVGDEAGSIASVDKAEKGTNQAPLPSGKGSTAKHNTKKDPAPKTKAGMLNAMYGKLSAMKKADLHAMYSKMEGVEIEEDEEVVERPEFSYTDELDTLVENEATLSDEFKAKTAVLFETAIRSKLAEEVERLEDEYQSRLDEELNATRSDLVEKIDSYLNYVVEQWMEDNKLAVEQGLRTEIAEGFMSKLRDLFEDSYIDVPESKVDLVDELAEQVEELEEKLNASTASLLEGNQKLESFMRANIVREAARDLAETQVEKLASLVESLDFEDEESFTQKVKTVKESYFKKDVPAQEEDIQEDWEADQSVEVPAAMSAYLSAIQKTNK